MLIRTQCPHCSTALQVPQTAAGTKMRCGRCGEPFLVQAAAPPPSVEPIAEALPADHEQDLLEVLAADADVPGQLRCEVCRRPAPTAHVHFHEHIGAVVLMFHRQLSGKLCRQCIQKYFHEYTLKTLILGWWGMLSFFITPFCLLMNVISYLGASGVKSTLPRKYQDRAAVRRLLLAPAIGLLLMATLGVGWTIWDVGSVWVHLDDPPDPPPMRAQADPAVTAPRPPPDRRVRFQNTLVLSAARTVVALILIAGAVQMIRVRWYWLALTSSVMAFIPCLGPCCVLPAPFGLWSLIVLINNDVCEAFSSAKPPDVVGPP